MNSFIRSTYAEFSLNQIVHKFESHRFEKKRRIMYIVPAESWPKPRNDLSKRNLRVNFGETHI